MEHIGHFPCSFCSISFDCMCQGIHTGRSSQSFRHGGHHFRIDHCDDRHIVRVYADKLTFTLYIGDNIVDRNFCCCSGCGWYRNDRYTWVFGRCSSFQTSDIFKFRIGNDDTDCFCSIHGRTAADGDDIICFGIFKCLNTMFYIVDGRVRLDIRIELVCKSGFFQQICHF